MIHRLEREKEGLMKEIEKMERNNKANNQGLDQQLRTLQEEMDQMKADL